MLLLCFILYLFSHSLSPFTALCFLFEFSTNCVNKISILNVSGNVSASNMCECVCKCCEIMCCSLCCYLFVVPSVLAQHFAFLFLIYDKTLRFVLMLSFYVANWPGKEYKTSSFLVLILITFDSLPIQLLSFDNPTNWRHFSHQHWKHMDEVQFAFPDQHTVSPCLLLQMYYPLSSYSQCNSLPF